MYRISCAQKNNKITNKVKQKKANSFNAMENNYDRKKNFWLMYCVIAMLLHQFDTSIITALRLIDRLRMRTLSLSVRVDCSAFVLGTLCNRDRSISAHNLTHLSVLVCVIFFTSFSLLHPFSPADDDDDDDDDRTQCSRSFCSNAINLVDEILWPCAFSFAPFDIQIWNTIFRSKCFFSHFD